MIPQIQSKELSADGFYWNQLSPRIGSIDNTQRYFAVVTYFQFPDWDTAHSFWKSIVGRHCQRAQVRRAKRFRAGWEVKSWGMDQSTLASLIERDRTRKPKSLPLPPIRRDWSMSESYETLQYEAA